MLRKHHSLIPRCPLARALVTFAIVGAVAIAWSAPASAQHAGLHAQGAAEKAHGNHGTFLEHLHQILGKTLGALGMDDAQKAQLEVIHDTYGEDMMRLHHEVELASSALHDAQSGAFDEGAIRAAFSDWATAREEITVAMARLHSELRGVLTDEQLETLHGMHGLLQGAHEHFGQFASPGGRHH